MVVTQKGRYLKAAAISGGIALLMAIFFSGPALGFPVGIVLVHTLPQGLRGLWELMTPGQEAQAIAATEGLSLRHFWGGSGIAVDPAKRQLHLYAKPHYKVYDFADVRRWERNEMSGGMAVGTGLAVVSHNFATAAQNDKDSGLFIEVRDIEHPRWRVAFPRRHLGKELPRWMEVLRQSINERAS
jgi:hypothetical protein